MFKSSVGSKNVVFLYSFVGSQVSDSKKILTHPNVISCCKYDIFYNGCARHVARMSMRKEEYHKAKASSLELVSYRFFIYTK